MPRIDKATGRVVALIALIVLAGAALRGYLPDRSGTGDQQPRDSLGAMIFIAVMIVVSVAIIAAAIVIALRNPRRSPRRAEAPSDDLAGDWDGRRWRIILIGLAVLIVWLAIVMLLVRLTGRIGFDQSVQPTVPTSTAPTQGTSSPPAAPPKDERGDVLAYLAAATIALVLLSGVGTIIGRRRRPIDHSPVIADRSDGPADTPAASESLARAAELGLVEIGDVDREPRQAIIACYAAMERALARAPGSVPQDSDTPSEVLARAVEHHALGANTATELVNLFAEARFSPHLMTEEHRETAIRVLHRVLEELRSAV